VCERYDRILKVNKGGERMRREVYLPRLWTDKPVKLKGETLNIINKKGGGEGEKEGKKRRRATKSEGICERT